MPEELTGAQLITNERQRQINEKGHTFQHDDKHIFGEVACAAAVYATPPAQRTDNDIDCQIWPDDWERKDYDRIKELTVAGALCAAEIDRLKRLAKRKKAEAKKNKD